MKKVNGYRKMEVDVMQEDHFIFTLQYWYNPIFKVKKHDIYDQILKERPTLRNKQFTAYLPDGQVQFA